MILETEAAVGRLKQIQYQISVQSPNRFTKEIEQTFVWHTQLLKRLKSIII